MYRDKQVNSSALSEESVLAKREADADRQKAHQQQLCSMDPADEDSLRPTTLLPKPLRGFFPFRYVRSVLRLCPRRKRRFASPQAAYRRIGWYPAVFLADTSTLYKVSSLGRYLKQTTIWLCLLQQVRFV